MIIEKATTLLVVAFSMYIYKIIERSLQRVFRV